MKTALVRLDYQGLTVSFNEDGWFDATAAAAHYGKRPVLYCAIFAHGLMKVGATTNMPSRLEALSAHGLLKPLLARLIICPCRKDILFKAEKIALRRFSLLSEKHGDEVFSTIPLPSVKTILRSSIRCLWNKPIYKRKIDYDEIAKKSNMYEAFAFLAKAARESISEKEAIDFVLSNIPENGDIDEHQWIEAFDSIHPFSSELIPHLGVRNVVLIGRGLSYSDRKLLLKQYAIDLRPDAPAIETAA